MFQSKQNNTPQEHYDKTNIEDLEAELTKLYFKDNKKDVIDEESYKKLKRTVENLKAKSDFDIAMYYLKIGKKNAAKVYLETIIEEYPKSVYAERAKEEIKKLTK
jgi:TolA-binding protein